MICSRFVLQIALFAVLQSLATCPAAESTGEQQRALEATYELRLGALFDAVQETPLPEFFPVQSDDGLLAKDASERGLESVRLAVSTADGLADDPRELVDGHGDGSGQRDGDGHGRGGRSGGRRRRRRDVNLDQRRRHG